MTTDIKVGIAGWTYDDWKGVVYPSPCPDPLRYVSRFVDCIEINSSFYRVPASKTVATWQSKVANRPDFYFTAKLHQSFTHQATLDPGTIQAFHEGFAPLLEAQQLKHLLVQFKYDFDYAAPHAQQLQRLVDHFGGAFDLALEVRHRSWQSPEALAFLSKLPLTICSLDYPTNALSFTHVSTQGTHGYMRLHGRNAKEWFRKSSRDETYNYYYNATELEEMKAHIQSLAKAFKVLTVITNNHFRGAELANALELRALLNNQPLEVPEGLLETYPSLNRIATNKSLFGDRQ